MLDAPHHVAVNLGIWWTFIWLIVFKSSCKLCLGKRLTSFVSSILLSSKQALLKVSINSLCGTGTSLTQPKSLVRRKSLTEAVREHVTI